MVSTAEIGVMLTHPSLVLSITHVRNHLLDRCGCVATSASKTCSSSLVGAVVQPVPSESQDRPGLPTSHLLKRPKIGLGIRDAPQRDVTGRFLGCRG
jgi:hypothetical protein